MSSDATLPLAAQAIFVTGGGKGLGRGIATLLASQGAAVGVADIDGAACEETCRAIVAAGGRAHGYTLDVSNRTLFLEAAGRFSAVAGGLNAVVNNAAILVYEPIEAVTENTIDQLMGAGFKSVIWGAQALLQHMDPKTGGALVNCSSPVAFRGYPKSAIYSAVKGAVTSATRVLAAELGPRHVRVNAIVPGSIPTPGAIAYVDRQEYERRAQTQIPLRRLGSEADVAQAVAFLLGPHAQFIHGAFLTIDGGILACG